ncbi:DNA methyltransferase [Hungatella hathewayi]|nr:DNA methyltransferase [Hungatella hathewayi]
MNLEQPNSKTRRGRVGKGVAQTLTTGCKQGTLDGTRIRRLTPKECFRLQGWEDEYFKRAAMVNSDSQIYKQAGNGVTVSVIKAIAMQLN